MKTFKPTYEMIQAANCVFMAMAYTETIRPAIEKIQNDLLAFWKFEPSKKWTDRGMSDLPKIITKWSQTYLLSDNDSRILFAECDEQVRKAGFKAKPECCPLLEAESVERIAKRLLIDVMQPIIKMTADDLICSKNGLENYRKAIDLTLRLLAPYCDKKVQFATM